MAYRRSNGKRTRKVEPMITTLRFPNQSVPASGSGTYFIDMMQCASLLNRKFMRQGLNVAVAGFKFLTSTGNPDNRAEGSVIVSKIPTTWVMANAWVKGMSTWMRMIEDNTEESDSIRPRFMDFKIFADAEHHQLGFDGNLLPISLGSTAVAGEWKNSKMVIPKTDGTDDVSNRDIIAVGANYPGASPVTGDNAVSLIEGYAASRALPSITDPNMPDDAKSTDIVAAENWMQATFNEGTDQSTEVIEDLLLDNNQAPYPFENAQIPGAPAGTVFTDTYYPGGANQLTGLSYHALEFITSTTVGGTTRVKGGAFPCGLVRLDFTNTGTAPFDVAIELELVPGPHRGLLCEPMQELN